MKKLQILLISLFILIIAFNVGSVVKTQWQKYTSHDYWQRFPSIEKVFLNSQYVNKHPKEWIPDEEAFTYAAGMYIKGINPVLVVPDAPPLGKYLIGLSIVFFNNEHDIILISAVISLVLLFLLGLQIFKNSLLALIPPLLLSFEKIFTNQLIYTPLLDLFQLVFLLTSVLSFNHALKIKSKKWVFFILAGLSMGLFMSTKFFVSGLTVLFTWFVILLLNKNWRSLIPVSVSSLLSLSLVPLSYVRVFAFGYSFRSFLGIQKWVFLYHKSQLILPLSIWPLLLINRWYVWYGDKPYIHDTQWSITWPILTFILFLTALLLLFKKFTYEKEIGFIIIWPFVYLLAFSIGEIFSRYFVILIPILYVVAIYFFQQLWVIYKRRAA